MAETDKNTRILELHTMLTRGECLRKKDLAQRFGVTEKSIQRDIEDLRDFFTRSGEPRVLAYDAKERAYVLRADAAERTGSYQKTARFFDVCAFRYAFG